MENNRWSLKAKLSDLKLKLPQGMMFDSYTGGNQFDIPKDLKHEGIKKQTCNGRLQQKSEAADLCGRRNTMRKIIFDPIWTHVRHHSRSQLEMAELQEFKKAVLY